VGHEAIVYGVSPSPGYAASRGNRETTHIGDSRREVGMNRLDRIVVRQALETGSFRLQGIEVELKSGRKFRYQLHDYPFRVDASDAELANVVRQIIMDKYRYCEWDRDHPNTNSEVEIYDALRALLSLWVARARQVRAKDEAAKNG
jgi:hypothetical protein